MVRARNSAPIDRFGTGDSELRVAFVASIVGWRFPRGGVAWVPPFLYGFPGHRHERARGVRRMQSFVRASLYGVACPVRAAATELDARLQLQVATRGGTDEQRQSQSVDTRRLRTKEQAQRPWPRHVRRSVSE